MQAEQVYSVSDFQAVCNQIMETAFSGVIVEGEVASFKINQDKFVFFDLKDDQSSVGCFMMKFALRFPLEDGMKIRVRAIPKLTNWGKFSLTVQAIMPVGEGSLKKSFELLKKKLTSEGLFAPERKRPLPIPLTKIGVISSTQAAGYADFCKILNERWGGLEVQVAHTQVQGLDAPDQIIRAIKYFNEQAEVEAIAILRGGGSADDLAAFNDEELVRTVAASRIPIVAGIGHEVDEALVDLAADVRASTPSNAAEMLTRDRAEEALKLARTMSQLKRTLLQKIEKMRSLNVGKVERIMHGLLVKYIEPMRAANKEKMKKCLEKIQLEYNEAHAGLTQKMKLLNALNPEKVLRQGYAILAGKVSPGSVVKITTYEKEIAAEIKEIKERMKNE